MYEPTLQSVSKVTEDRKYMIKSKSNRGNKELYKNIGTDKDKWELMLEVGDNVIVYSEKEETYFDRANVGNGSHGKVISINMSSNSNEKICLELELYKQIYHNYEIPNRLTPWSTTPDEIYPIRKDIISRYNYKIIKKMSEEYYKQEV